MAGTESDSEAAEDHVKMTDLEEGERESLMERAASDAEVYSLRKFVKARSFHLALLVSFTVIIVIVVVLAVTAVVIATTSSSSSSTSGSSGSGGNTITLDDVFNSDFAIHYYSGSWTLDNRLLEQTSESGVTLCDPSDNTTETLINATEWARLNGEFDNKLSSAVPSSNYEYFLLVVNVEKVFRHSFLADYYIYNRQTSDLVNLTKPAKSLGRIQFAKWSPSSDVIAYVLDNDIYVYKISGDELEAVTSGGAVNEIYHGIPDWVYEEEVLATNFALWWSYDGTYIMFATFNDTAVKRYQFPKYGLPDNEYTDIETIAYPKPGTANPSVSLYVVDISDPTNHSKLSPPSTVDEQDHYFVFAGWASSSSMFVTWMNRSQQNAVYCVYDLATKQCDPVYTQKSSGWIELIQKPKFFDNGAKYLALISQDQGNDSFIHIAELTVSTKDKQFLTGGEWEVTSILGTDGNDTLYVSTETSPRQRHVYSTKTKTCLTCSAAQASWDVPKSTNPSIQDGCDYFGASCSESLEFCVLQCYGPAVPYTLLMRFDQEQGKFEKVKNLETNPKLLEVIANKTLPTVNTFEVPTNEQGAQPLNGQIIFPPNFKSDQEYPVLVYVYGGPYSQTVSNTTILNSLSRLYFVSNLSIILVSVDGRGTGFRGDNFKYSVYRHLGEYETVDQLRAGKYLQGLKYVDSSKLAIYGASYGGYMAGMVGSSGSGVYSTAISQSPVSDWLYYDSIYTERYMSWPEDNPSGYKNSSVLGRAQHLSDVNYLLIHGTGDDNVHFQNTAQLVHALTEADVQFRMQIYTDKAHSLSGDATRRHLYELITDFLRGSFHLS